MYLNFWHQIEIGYVGSLPTAKAIKFNVWKEKQKKKVSGPATDRINRVHSPCRIGVYALKSVWFLAVRGTCLVSAEFE